MDLVKKKWIVNRLKSKEKGLDFVHNICYNCDIHVLANPGKNK